MIFLRPIGQGHASTVAKNGSSEKKSSSGHVSPWETEIQTAARVAKLIFDSGLARVERPADVVALIREHVYQPVYPAEPAPVRKAA
jgi:hypothetical protein